jgi:hypothetical protein
MTTHFNVVQKLRFCYDHASNIVKKRDVSAQL